MTVYSKPMQQYLKLEKQMLALAEKDDESEELDKILDTMDGSWDKLCATERAWLRGRE